MKKYFLFIADNLPVSCLVALNLSEYEVFYGNSSDEKDLKSI